MHLFTFQAYQEQAHSTAIYTAGIEKFLEGVTVDELKFVLQLNYATGKLNGEAGEVAEQVGKLLRDDAGYLTQERAAKIEKELGDTLWYVAEICTIMGWSLEELAEKNIEKLSKRQQEGTLNGDGSER